ncbi:MAG: hypothetical protein M3463_02000 [Verrucomicrobiota bacterium]|nr:hypothetical protein [Verrucomicrobiota bacterium]
MSYCVDDVGTGLLGAARDNQTIRVQLGDRITPVFLIDGQEQQVYDYNDFIDDMTIGVLPDADVWWVNPNYDRIVTGRLNWHTLKGITCVPPDTVG